MPGSLPEHRCSPKRLAGRRAHGTPAGTTVTCPCGKHWRITKNHLGQRGRICGCGWARVTEAGETWYEPEEAAA